MVPSSKKRERWARAEDLMFNKKRKPLTWKRRRAQPQYEKNQERELDGWRIPSEIQAEERHKRKEKGTFERLVCASQCV